MYDQEKAIKGLETCIKHIDRECPIFCPYHEMCTKCKGYVVLQPLLIDVLALLKEQEAKEVKVSTNMYTGLPITHCPKCGVSLDRYLYGRQHEGQVNYCPYCGQEVTWNA